MAPFCFVATTIGYLCKITQAKGVIHSVFDHAMNIQLTDNPSQLITLTFAPLPQLPTGIQCKLMIDGENRLVNPNWQSLFEVGSHVSLGQSAIHIESEIFGQVTVDLTSAQIWQKPDIRPIGNQIKLGQLQRQHLTSVAMWIVYCLSEALPEVNLSKSQSGKEVFLKHKRYWLSLGIDFQTFKSPDSQPVIEIIGLGSGLTPSGDDFACGMLASLYLLTTLQNYLEPSLIDLVLPLETKLRSGLLEQSAKTNSISWHYIAQAIASDFSEPLTLLLQCIVALLEQTKGLRMDPLSLTDLFDAVTSVQAIGSHSGHDILMGVIHGLSVFDESLLARYE